MSLRQTYLEREGVIWFGSDPDPELRDEFDSRGLKITTVATDPDLDQLRGARAVVFQYEKGKPGALMSALRATARAARNHGLQLVVRADEDGSIPQIEAILHTEHVPALIRTPDPLYLLPEGVARYSAGPFTNPGLNIFGITDLDADTRLLLSRSFADCKHISIAMLSGGRSAEAYFVSATLAECGGIPLPFFAKVDRVKKITREVENYERYADGYVPFNHRPNLAEGRCVLGADKGLLVGSFVEQSETLLDVARRGTGDRAIYSLFEHALRGWRLQAYESPEYKRFIEEPLLSITHSMKPRLERPVVAVNQIDTAVHESAVSMGARDARALMLVLEGLSPIVHRRAPVHGDLHARNVQVHGTDAILIDFNAVHDGPLVEDPASLEVSMVFDGYLDEGATGGSTLDRRQRWAALVNRIYEPQNLDMPPPPIVPHFDGRWLWSGVRQTRMYALASENAPKAYRVALAVQMLRKAAHKPEDEEDAFRRAYLCVAADKLVRQVEAMS